MNANKYDKHYDGKVRYTYNGCVAGYTDKSSNDYSGDGIVGIVIKAIIMIALVACIVAVIAVF